MGTGVGVGESVSATVPRLPTALILVLLASLLLAGLSTAHPGPPPSIGRLVTEVERSARACSAGCPSAPRSSSLGPENSTSLLTWTSLFDRYPVNVTGAGMVADSSLALAVQFGGDTATGLTNSTLEYNEASDTWTALAEPPGAVPSARAGFAFASDAATGEAVLFGGETNAGTGLSANDTWLFNFSSGTWRNVTGPVAPAPRQDAAFSIDPTLGVGLLFGGSDPDYQGTGEVTFSDTWEFNLSTDVWSRVTVPSGTGPPAVYGAGMTWDPSTQTFELFGGCYPCSDRVWQFSPLTADWAVLEPGGGTVPAPRMESVWVYDPFLQGDVLFGGTDGSTVYGDTTIFLPLSNSWSTQQAAGAPDARYGASAAWFDVYGNETLLMSGGSAAGNLFNGTWRLASPASLSVRVEAASGAVPIEYAVVRTGVVSSGITNAQGYSNTTGLPSEEITLNVSAAGFQTFIESLWLPPGQSTVFSVLLSGVAPAAVEVHVALSSGVPFVGALVNVTVGDRPVTPGLMTDQYGWANYSSVPAFEGTATAWAPGFHTASVAGNFGPGQTVVERLVLTPLTLLEIRVLGELPNGTVVRLQNASVLLNSDLLGLSGPTGELNVSTTDLGSELLTATAPYFGPNTTDVLVPPTGVAPATIELRSAPPGDLDLTVVSAQTLQQVSSAQLNFTVTPPVVDSPAKFSESAARGVLLTPFLAGNYTLTAWAPGFQENRTVPPQWLQPGILDSLTVALTPVPEGAIHSLILDNASHQPIGSASVVLVSIGTLLSDTQGWANFSSLSAGTYEIIASATGYDTNQSTLALSAGEVLPRYAINLTRAHSGPSPGGQNNLALLPPDATSVWPLLLLPGVALVLAAVYLTILRAPAAPVPEVPVPAAPPAGRSRRAGFWGRLRPERPPKGETKSSGQRAPLAAETAPGGAPIGQEPDPEQHGGDTDRDDHRRVERALEGDRDEPGARERREDH